LSGSILLDAPLQRAASLSRSSPLRQPLHAMTAHCGDTLTIATLVASHFRRTAKLP
jgi:hypothetical protein